MLIGIYSKKRIFIMAKKQIGITVGREEQE